MCAIANWWVSLEIWRLGLWISFAFSGMCRRNRLRRVFGRYRHDNQTQAPGSYMSVSKFCLWANFLCCWIAWSRSRASMANLPWAILDPFIYVNGCGVLGKQREISHIGKVNSIAEWCREFRVYKVHRRKCEHLSPVPVSWFILSAWPELELTPIFSMNTHHMCDVKWGHLSDSVSAVRPKYWKTYWNNTFKI